MKKIYLFAVILFLLMTGNGLTVGITPQIVSDPYDSSGINKVVKFQVSEYGDESWIYLPVTALSGDINDHFLHPIVKVSFDIARPYDSKSEWFAWGWVDLSADSLDDIVPSYGGQIQWDPSSQRLTYPFYDPSGTVVYNTADTVFATIPDFEYAHLELTWDFANKKVSSSYAGSNIDINYDMVNMGTGLHGFQISLSHPYDKANQGDIAYIDNFMITGSDLYNSNGFDNFPLGSLNQNGWLSGNENTTVPEPSVFILLTSGLVGIIGFRKQIKL